jgi:hypothetical protein
MAPRYGGGVGRPRAAALIRATSRHRHSTDPRAPRLMLTQVLLVASAVASAKWPPLAAAVPSAFSPPPSPLRLALWAPSPEEDPGGADPALATAVHSALQSHPPLDVSRISTAELSALRCGDYEALVLVQAPLLPAVGGEPSPGRCTLPSDCLAGLASTVSWFLQPSHGPATCDAAWRHAAAAQVGPNSTHHRCPSSAGRWGSSQLLRDCIPGVIAAASARNASSCSPELDVRPVMRADIGTAIFRHAGGGGGGTGDGDRDAVVAARGGGRSDDRQPSCYGHVLVIGGKPPHIALSQAIMKAESAGELLAQLLHCFCGGHGVPSPMLTSLLRAWLGNVNVMSDYEPYHLRGESRVVPTAAWQALSLPPLRTLGTLSRCSGRCVFFGGRFD